jgi:tRNA-specific 2-thiouridylase
MEMVERVEYLNCLGFEVNEQTLIENSLKTVIVGMSGGVDSSSTAILVKLLGYKTIGMFMKNWEEIDADGVCTAEEDFHDVIKVCEEIDIPYYSVNFSEEYKNNVFKDFVSEYKLGHTPNPDILCNREIKFKVFFEKAKSFGADFLATGHYCQSIEENGKTKLVKGLDRNKDQTYFLYAIKESVLKDVMFPIGHLPKPKVREVAEKFNLITYDKKDSTGICFIGERNFKEFLSNYIKGQKGNFVNLDNNRIMGTHDGMCFYTIGQRKGLGLGGPGGPWFVAKKDIENNIVYVVDGEQNPALYADELVATEASWIGDAPSLPLKCMAKIRYRQADQECLIELKGEDLHIKFGSPQRAIAIRQSIVFYLGDICLGGAIIKLSGLTYKEMDKKLPIS